MSNTQSSAAGTSHDKKQIQWNTHITHIQNMGEKSTFIFPESHLTLKACTKLGRSNYLHAEEYPLLKNNIQKNANNTFFARGRKWTTYLPEIKERYLKYHVHNYVHVCKVIHSLTLTGGGSASFLLSKGAHQLSPLNKWPSPKQHYMHEVVFAGDNKTNLEFDHIKTHKRNTTFSCK